MVRRAPPFGYRARLGDLRALGPRWSAFRIEARGRLTHLLVTSKAARMLTQGEVTSGAPRDPLDNLTRVDVLLRLRPMPSQGVRCRRVESC